MSDQDQALQLHNRFRADAVAKHGSTCGPLVWDGNLANDAQQWAQHMADTDTLEHSGVANNGAAKSTTTAARTYFPPYAHYTQVVWPTTTAVGMGIARSASGKVYVCGRYSPAGNREGQPAWGPGGNAGQGGGNPQQQHADGVYCVNSFRGDQSSSGFAYYSNIGSRQPGQQPDAYVDLQTTGVVTWEGGNFQATFKDGDLFKASVNADAATAPLGVQVGMAANNFHNFNIFRGDLSNIYTIDGWNVFAIYQCL